MYQLITNCQGKSCIRLSGKDLPQRRRGRGEKPGGEGGKGGKGSRGGEEDARRVKRSVEIAITAEGRQGGGVPLHSKEPCDAGLGTKTKALGRGGCGASQAERRSGDNVGRKAKRRRVQIEQIKYIGKESNTIEDVDSGLAHCEADVYTHYPDPQRDELETQIRPALREVRLILIERETGLSRRTLIYARTGKRKPHRKHRELLVSTLRRLSLV
jgi:hypothetical protein